MQRPERRFFGVPEDVAYLNCAYMAPQLLSVREAGEAALARKARPWEFTPQDFFDGPEEVRDLFARLVGGDPAGVAIVPSVSYGIAVAAANLPIARGQKVLVLEDQFPSNLYPWRELAREREARVVVVPRPPDYEWTEAVLGELDDATAVVTVPNCHWTDGSLIDLARVRERTLEVGAALVVDGIQSVGARPLDVREVRPDFLVVGAYKWMLGPYGVGFMYVDEKYRDGRPIEHNWINRRGSQDFANLVDYRDEFQPGARRYDVGERSNFVLLPMAAAAMRQLLDWGVENVEEAIGRITDLVEEQASRHGMETVPRDRRARHMTGLRLGRGVPTDLAARLAAQNVFVSVRGDSIRVSPHLHNTAGDVEKLFAALLEATAR
jgi:selenocysteine lyase/cysteine desulfurase